LANGDAPPRIFKVTYRSAVNGRVARAFVKVPYSGQFDMVEKLARMQAKRQILWFRVDVAKSAEIAEHRSQLARWLEALTRTTPVTRVDWLA
jgi:hypothetical protein